MNRPLLIALTLLLSRPAFGALLTPQDVLTAVEHHPKALASLAGLNAAKAQIDEARSDELPHLFAQIAGNWQGEETQAPTYIYTFGDKLDPLIRPLWPDMHIPKYVNLGYTVTGFKEAYEAQLGFTWLLSSGGAVQNNIASKRKAYDGLLAGHQRLMQGLRHGALTAYLGLIKAQAMQNVAAQYLQVTDEHVKQVSQFLERGVVAPVDLAKAKKARAEAEVAVATARDGLQRAKNALTYLTGTQTENFTLPEENAIVFDPSDLPTDRPETQALQDAAAAALWGEKAARGATETPKLFAQGGYKTQGRHWPPEERKDWNLSLALRWDFGDGGKSNALATQARAKATEYQEKVRDMQADIEREIADAKSAMDLANRKVTLADETLALARETARVTELKYRNGLSTETDLLDAILLRQQAESDALASRIDAKQAALNLAFALGDPIKALKFTPETLQNLLKKEEKNRA